MGVNSLPKTVTRQRRGCDLNPGRSAPESSTLTTRLPSHPRRAMTGWERQPDRRTEAGPLREPCSAVPVSDVAAIGCSARVCAGLIRFMYIGTLQDVPYYILDSVGILCRAGSTKWQ